MFEISFEETARPADYHNWYGMTEAAKLIDKKGIGRTNLYKFLRKNNILMGDNEPYQKYADQGYFKFVIKEIRNSYGKFYFTQTVTLVSEKGIEFIKRLLDKEEAKNE